MEEILQPIYRIEDYWYAIANGLSCPHTPIYRIEQYLAYLCGADVTVPQPIYRTEQYLAYKCGMDVEIPNPIYRQELFLAKWCGMEVDTPEPIYRIEYWLDLLANPAGELKTVTGNPISISDALAKPAESLTIEILPSQDLHGYANPWPAGGGINKVDITKHYTNGWTNSANSITAIYNNGVFTISGTSDSSSWTNIVNDQFAFQNDGFVIPAGTYTTPAHCTFVVNIAGTNTNKTGTFSLSESGTVIGFFITVAPNAATGWSIPLCLVEGSTAPSSYISYSNICPISGFTGVNIYHESAYDPDADPTYAIDWTDEAGTVYGCTFNPVSGVMTVINKMLDLGTLTYSKSSIVTNGFVATGGMPSDFPVAPSTDDVPNWKCSQYIVTSNSNIEKASVDRAITWRVSGQNKGVIIKDSNYASIYNPFDGGAFATAMSGVQLVYELETPQTIQLTPTQVQMLLGNNVIWNDVGDMILEYLADGPADDIDALNILLNNRYVNNGEPDEATDREALDILLGGNTR